MTVDQIQTGRVYRGTDGRTRKVQSVARGFVKVRDHTPAPKTFSIETFLASCAVEDVTPRASAVAVGRAS